MFINIPGLKITVWNIFTSCRYMSMTKKLKSRTQLFCTDSELSKPSQSQIQNKFSAKVTELKLIKWTNTVREKKNEQYRVEQNYTFYMPAH